MVGVAEFEGLARVAGVRVVVVLDVVVVVVVIITTKGNWDRR